MPSKEQLTGDEAVEAGFRLILSEEQTRRVTFVPRRRDRPRGP
ncbi:hypothetical protein [Fimbriiglobus ruber]|uniref:Uncharacterized protein n=1 Tax=Fimbriiglobus ruber TaxID=1908690 RepID=A0A225DSV6_9BACT|nr:hypothetical protein [Fimbriiglobus ruber]OWK39187.1 hypothetical protein FRUB_06269 [Fimbriiglobus ruber]